MRRSLIALSLVSFLMQSSGTGFGQAGQGTQGRDESYSKARIAVIKASTTAKVSVVLNDKTKLKGFIVNAGDDCFTLVDAKTSKSSCIDYTNVLRVERQRRPAWKDWVGLGAAVGIPIVILAVALRSPY